MSYLCYTFARMCNLVISVYNLLPVHPRTRCPAWWRSPGSSCSTSCSVWLALPSTSPRFNHPLQVGAGSSRGRLCVAAIFAFMYVIFITIATILEFKKKQNMYNFWKLNLFHKMLNVHCVPTVVNNYRLLIKVNCLFCVGNPKRYHL